MIKIKRIDSSYIKDVADLIQSNYNNQDKDYFYKHFQWVFKNKTYMIVAAFNEEKLIALRPAMGWNLKYKDDKILTYQLTGTIVHKEFRKKGLFTKTNKFFLENLYKVHQFIFNISVDLSRKGYEKLGWSYLSGFHRLTKINLYNFFFNRYSQNLAENEKENNFNNLDTLFEKRNKRFFDYIHTDYTLEFFQWRISNTKTKYHTIHIKEFGFSVYKINFRNNKKEIVLGEFFLAEYNYNCFKQLFKAIIKKEKPVYTTVYIFENHPLYSYYKRSGFIPNYLNYNLNFGVKTVNQQYRSLALNNSKWAISSLDLDTF